jgi:hypothetical protein
MQRPIIYYTPCRNPYTKAKSMPLSDSVISSTVIGFGFTLSLAESDVIGHNANVVGGRDLDSN